MTASAQEGLQLRRPLQHGVGTKHCAGAFRSGGIIKADDLAFNQLQLSPVP